MKTRAIIGAVALLCIGILLAQRSHLLRQPEVRASAMSIPTTPAEEELEARLWRIGVAKDESQIDTAIQALQSLNPLVRRTAAIALGRIGSEKALAPLERIRDEVPDYKLRSPRARPARDPKIAEAYRELQRNMHELHVSPAARMAIARIKSSRGHGVSRLELFEKALGVSRGNTITASKRPRESRLEGLPPVSLLGKRVCTDRVYMTYILELLAEEKRNGRDVSRAIRNLDLDEPERLRVELASAPPKERVRALADHVAALKAVKGGQRHIGLLLAAEGTPAVPIIIDRLRADFSSSGRLTAGGTVLVNVLGAIGDKSAEPFLEELRQSKDMWTRYYAELALKSIKTGKPGILMFGLE